MIKMHNIASIRMPNSESQFEITCGNLFWETEEIEIDTLDGNDVRNL